MLAFESLYGESGSGVLEKASGSTTTGAKSSSSSPSVISQYSGAILNVAGNISEQLQDYGNKSWDRELLKYEGHLSEVSAKYDEMRLRNEVNKKIGTAVANAGASGFTVESSMDVIEDLIYSGELDAALIRIRGDIGKWRSDVEIDRMKSEGKKSMVSSIINSASSVASAYFGGK